VGGGAVRLLVPLQVGGSVVRLLVPLQVGGSVVRLLVPLQVPSCSSAVAAWHQAAQHEMVDALTWPGQGKPHHCRLAHTDTP
jgi:hypothetical protein